MRKIYLLAVGIIILCGNSFAQDTSSTISIIDSCDAPNNLQVWPVDLCTLLVKWTPPDEITPQYNTWLYWDLGTNYTGIGHGGPLQAAVRFTPEQISEFGGTTLTRIRLFPVEPGGYIVLKVWSGPNASDLMRSQPVSAYTPGQWNEFVLNEPMPIDPSRDLWIGYETNQYVAGVDAGPAYSGYADMISMDGVVWESLSLAYGFNYNWNIRGGVAVIDKEMELKRSEPVAGYNLYRDDTLIAYTSSIEYNDDITYHPSPEYNVTAVYQDCESEYSQTVYYPTNCNVAVNNINQAEFYIYPNPASGKVTVNYKSNVSKLTLIDMMGRELAEYSIAPGSTSMTLDLTSFPEGVYLLRFEEADCRIYGKKLVRQR